MADLSMSLLKPVNVVDQSLVGKYCMVYYVYDGLSYSGIILTVNEDYVEVKTMSRIGRNRWFCPMRDDILCVESDVDGSSTSAAPLRPLFRTQSRIEVHTNPQSGKDHPDL
ncbi:hypothetical protein DPMN_088779 [Dreissena polymorpha]|uniref:Uncharacterized protein n=1 Tax=Dreissena polymorpha TaxID=45954 RepID=A0A9D4QXF0_DREPO|nr:hypothetical protein DPMN_088779 [Dreissena polymorpha]